MKHVTQAALKIIEMIKYQDEKSILRKSTLQKITMDAIKAAVLWINGEQRTPLETSRSQKRGFHMTLLSLLLPHGAGASLLLVHATIGSITSDWSTLLGFLGPLSHMEMRKKSNVPLLPSHTSG